MLDRRAATCKSGTITFAFQGTGTSSGTQLHAETTGATGALPACTRNLTVDVAGIAVAYSGTAHFTP